MTSSLTALCFDAQDPRALARFWAVILGRDVSSDGVTLLPGTDLEFAVRFDPTDAPKVGRNQMHFDLTSASLDDQQQIVARSLELGARHLDVGQRPEEGHFVLADPEGNEFCVIEPENNFLADTGTIGALSCDGTRAVGCFWSQALGWPLVWDQDEETAIQSSAGGSKISWGGPPVNPKRGRNRLRLELAPHSDDQQVEVERLLSLGASRSDAGLTRSGRLELTDPDGNEFCVQAGPSSPA